MINNKDHDGSLFYLLLFAVMLLTSLQFNLDIPGVDLPDVKDLLDRSSW